MRSFFTTMAAAALSAAVLLGGCADQHLELSSAGRVAPTGSMTFCGVTDFVQVQKPGHDVPANYQAFFGSWLGTVGSTCYAVVVEEVASDGWAHIVTFSGRGDATAYPQARHQTARITGDTLEYLSIQQWPIKLARIDETHLAFSFHSINSYIRDFTGTLERAPPGVAASK